MNRANTFLASLLLAGVGLLIGCDNSTGSSGVGADVAGRDTALVGSWANSFPRLSIVFGFGSGGVFTVLAVDSQNNGANRFDRESGTWRTTGNSLILIYSKDENSPDGVAWSTVAQGFSAPDTLNYGVSGSTLNFLIGGVTSSYSKVSGVPVVPTSGTVASSALAAKPR